MGLLAFRQEPRPIPAASMSKLRSRVENSRSGFSLLVDGLPEVQDALSLLSNPRERGNFMSAVFFSLRMQPDQERWHSRRRDCFDSADSRKSAIRDLIPVAPVP